MSQSEKREYTSARTFGDEIPLVLRTERGLRDSSSVVVIVALQSEQRERGEAMKKALSMLALIAVVLSVFAFAQDTGGER